MVDRSHVVSFGSKSKHHYLKISKCALMEHLRMIITLSHLTEMS